MNLSRLRGTDLLNELSCYLRSYSLPISVQPSLKGGGSGTLVSYKSFRGILTATHVMANDLDTREVYAPIKKTSDPSFFLNEKIPVKGILCIETPQAIQLFRDREKDWPENALDICLVEIEEHIFSEIIQKSGKHAINLLSHQENYHKNFDKYCCSHTDWCWAFYGYPREEANHDEYNILKSRFDGVYVSGGAFRKETPLTQVIVQSQMGADLWEHQLGKTADILPKSFEGMSGAGVWQISFRGEDGIPLEIDEAFFFGVFVAQASDCLLTRGPTSLYDIFLNSIYALLK